MAQREMKRIVRIANTSLDGTKHLRVALTHIKGVGFRMAEAVTKAAGIPGDRLLGELTEEEVSRIEEILSRPSDFGIPDWMQNRRFDPETGETRHLLGDDIAFVVKQDIAKMKRIRSWKGIRHHLGLKVRGQRTKSTGRVGRTVGYQKKK